MMRYFLAAVLTAFVLSGVAFAQSYDGSGNLKAVIKNSTGASAVNIQDGGNSITVDNGGTFATQAAQSGTWNINSVTVVDSISNPVTVENVTPLSVNASLLAGTSYVGKVRITDGTSDTIMPTAASDGFNNTYTRFPVASFPQLFNGSTWDRLRGVSATLNSTGTGLLGAQMIGQFDDTSPTTITENQFGNVRISSNRNAYTTIRDAAGNERGANVNASNQLSVSVDNTVAVGNVATIGTSITPGTAAANLGKAEDAAHSSGDTGVLLLGRRIDTQAASSGASGDYETINIGASGGVYMVPSADAGAIGATVSSTISAASTNATSVKGSAGIVYSISVTNTNASPRYLKLYNKASAPTVGTDTPVWRVLIPGNTSGAGNNPQLPPMGLAFGTGIAFALTTGVADSDTGAVAANEIIVNIGYK